ncbi:hypothetical protein [Azoarcus olearius]|uniref:Conserved hypothetical membrane protein n=1 Tax=Azoarcus sp. (strain BH72) TaxID=418699 RepID=A1KA46_AZOSB|nr:hypothetical protein [Azoarcus olearius]CAL95702.1 conserved hypothetical membrane protein [Azoarcus olearius]
MAAELSFEQAPPLSVPLRFFFTAPLFALAAGLLLVLRGDAVFASRWTPEALALTHLLTVGMMLQVMVGALFQVLPVAAGANLWRPRVLAALVHPALTLGGIALAAGFLGAGALAFHVAIGLLGTALAAVFACASAGLWRTPALGPTVWGLRAAVVALAVAAALGFALALARNGVLQPAWLALSALHQGWALGGWAGLLLAAVAWLVVPMFLLTPSYPAWFARALSIGVAVLMVAGSALWLSGWQSAEAALAIGLALAAAAFAAATLALQRRRRRKVADACLRFWQLAMASLAALAPLLAWDVAAGDPTGGALPVLVGVLALAGGFLSVMLGMLYKIVPFILWLHLRRRISRPPAMTRLVTEGRQLLHFRLHLAGVGALLVAVWLPLAAIAAGVLLALSGGLLAANLGGALKVYLAAGAGAEPARQPG